MVNTHNSSILLCISITIKTYLKYQLFINSKLYTFIYSYIVYSRLNYIFAAILKKNLKIIIHIQTQCPGISWSSSVVIAKPGALWSRIRLLAQDNFPQVQFILFIICTLKISKCLFFMEIFITLFFVSNTVK